MTFTTTEYRMLLTAIYISLYLFTASLFFVDSRLLKQYEDALVWSHLFSVLFLILDFFFINLKGVWLDRLVVLTVLITGSAIFSLYRRNFRLLIKCYFGLFFAYPVLCLVVYCIDRIFFTIVATPLIATLVVPQNVFSNKDYDVREKSALLAPKRLQLIKKGLITERVIGTCSDENVVHLQFYSMEVLNQTSDTINVIVRTGDSTLQVAFTN